MSVNYKNECEWNGMVSVNYPRKPTKVRSFLEQFKLHLGFAIAIFFFEVLKITAALELMLR